MLEDESLPGWGDKLIQQEECMPRKETPPGLTLNGFPRVFIYHFGNLFNRYSEFVTLTSVYPLTGNNVNLWAAGQVQTLYCV